MVRVAVGVGVGDGDGVGVDVGVAVGVGLVGGDDCGELPGEADAGGDTTGAGGAPPWPPGVLLGLVCVVLDGVTDGVLEPVRVAEPSGLPPPPWLLEAGAPEFPLCK